MLANVLLIALPFVWFGMTVAISFIETPLKFQAPGMTHALGVGIGRLVFKVLNQVEAVLAVVLVLAWATAPGTVGAPAAVLLVLAMAALALQMLVLRPAMSKRTKALSLTAVEYDGGAPVKAKIGTNQHIAYITAESVKVLALPIAGVLSVLAIAG